MSRCASGVSQFKLEINMIIACRNTLALFGNTFLSEHFDGFIKVTHNEVLEITMFEIKSGNFEMSNVALEL